MKYMTDPPVRGFGGLSDLNSPPKRNAIKTKIGRQNGGGGGGLTSMCL